MEEFLGKKFGKWTVSSYLGQNKNRAHQFNVICDCGNQSISDKIALTRGKSTQCRSCARKKHTSSTSNPAFTHGYSSVNHKYFHVYTAWLSMKGRCYRISDTNYPRYGEKGIKVCDAWLNSFENFLEDMGLPSKGYSLDRIDVFGNYEKNNCRWSDKDTQYNNCRRSVYYEYLGEKLSETQWSRKLGISRNKVMNWARKNGISWVIENLEIIKKTTKNMSDKKYQELGLDIPEKRFRKQLM